MKQVVMILIVVVFLAGICFAGEKEELQLQRENIQLKMQIIQNQFGELQKLLTEVNDKLKKYEPAPVAPAPKPEPEKKK